MSWETNKYYEIVEILWEIDSFEKFVPMEVKTAKTVKNLWSSPDFGIFQKKSALKKYLQWFDPHQDIICQKHGSNPLSKDLNGFKSNQARNLSHLNFEFQNKSCLCVPTM